MIKNYFLLFLLFYTVLVITKFIFSFYLGFDEIYPIFWGYKFDFAVSAFFAFFISMFSFNKILSKIFFIFSLTFVILTQIADIIYFSESHRHIGYEAKDIFVDFIPLLNTAFHKYSILAILTFITLFIIIFILSKINIYERFSKNYFLKSLFLLLITIFFARGMTQHIPLHPFQSNQIGDNKKAQVALNGTYNMIYALIKASKNPKMLNLPTFDEKTIKQNLSKLYYEKTSSLKIIKDKPNIVLFFSESWSAKWIDKYGFSAKTTPNFDYFYDNGISIDYMIANGHRTTEGIFAVCTSYPNPLGKTIAKTNLQNFSYDSFIYLFNKAGYKSIFFQGTSKDTSGTGSLAQFLGFKKSYGKRDIRKRIYLENYWGVQDIDLYNFILKKLPKNKPFIIGINGATTHDNVVPKNFKTKQFVKDKILNRDLNALYFADYALGKFIKEVEKRYPNTIFVLFADHCGGRISEVLESYKIPFVIYSKKYFKPKHFNLILSQLDIAPTLVDLIFGDYKKHFPNATGKSLFSDKKFFAPYFYNGILGWIEDKKQIEYNLQTKKLNCRYKKYICEKLNQNNLIFNYITQKLLFEGKTKEFFKWRNHE